MEMTINILCQMIAMILQMTYSLIYHKTKCIGQIQKSRKIAGRILIKIYWVSLVFLFNWTMFRSKKQKKEYEWNSKFKIKDIQINLLELWEIINSNFWKWGFIKETRRLTQTIVRWILLASEHNKEAFHLKIILKTSLTL
jgi:hypothetical protein